MGFRTWTQHLLRMVSPQGLPLPDCFPTARVLPWPPGLVSTDQMSTSMDTTHMHGWGSPQTPEKSPGGAHQKIPVLGEQWPIIKGRGGYVGEACFSPHTHSPPTNPSGQAEFIVLLLLSHLRDYVDITRETDFLTLIPTLMSGVGGLLQCEWPADKLEDVET